MALDTMLYALLNCQSNFSDLYGLFFSILMGIGLLFVLHFFSADRTILVWVPTVMWTFAKGFSLLINLKRKSVDEIVEPKPEDVCKDIQKIAANSTKPLKKQNKKKKSKSRKSKYKNMDEKKDDSTHTTMVSNFLQKTKIYQPLSKYLELNLEPHELYFHFIRYAMDPKQLIENGFPLDSPKRPESISAGRSPHSKEVTSNLSERSCCRCGEKFFVSLKGDYESNTNCRYHSGKITCYKGPCTGLYTCCNGDYLSEGCVIKKFHVSAQRFLDDVEFKKTRVKKHVNLRKTCNIYALDCEMCYTTGGFEVAKVGLVGPDGLTIYDSYVLPEHRVLDYNTAYSGVTANHLKGVTTTLADVQAFLVKQLNKNTILVGHGLENDLKVLQLIHETIVDTSVVFPHEYGGRYKRSLKSLAADYLQKTIQSSNNGHDCIEDARTCMELMLWKIHSSFTSNKDENKNSSVQNIVPPHQEMPLSNKKYLSRNISNNQVARNQDDVNVQNMRSQHLQMPTNKKNESRKNINNQMAKNQKSFSQLCPSDKICNVTVQNMVSPHSKTTCKKYDSRNHIKGQVARNQDNYFLDSDDNDSGHYDSEDDDSWNPLFINKYFQKHYFKTLSPIPLANE